MRVPSHAEVLAIGEELGYSFTDAEGAVVYDRLVQQLSSLESFAALRIPVEPPAPVRGARHEWRFASAEEDPHNAYITRCEVSSGEEGPLTDLRIALKDNIGMAGLPLTFGTEFMTGYIADFDATVVSRLLAAGATIIGKTNMYELSLGDVPGTYGRVLNPHDLKCETGGSSSGSAAAAANGSCDIALGGDQGGSIRIPASWCGVVGIKPTYGLVPHTGIFGTDPALDFVGPMGRRTRDVSRVLDILSGPDGFDHRQFGVPAVGAVTPTLEEGIEGLRVGVVTEAFEGCQEGVERTVRAAAEALAAAGADVADCSIPGHVETLLAWPPLFLEGTRYLTTTNFGGAFDRTWYPQSLIAAFGKFKAGAGHLLPMNYRTFMTIAEYVSRRYHGEMYAKAHNARAHFSKNYDAALENFDVLLMPTVLDVAQEYAVPSTFEEAIDMRVFGGAGLNLGALAKNVMQFNFTGHPALSVPCGKLDGRPVGMQLVGRHFEDALLLRTAFAYENTVDDWEALVTPA